MARRVLALMLLVAPGCATLFAGGPDHVLVSSNPPGAVVTVNGSEVGRTPTDVTLDRANSHASIGISAPGYQPVVIDRGKSFNGVAVLNCLNLLFWVIDLATSNTSKFDTTPIRVNLAPINAAPPPVRPPVSPEGTTDDSPIR